MDQLKGSSHGQAKEPFSILSFKDFIWWATYVFQ